ncbi:MAG: exo-alpha-sialidase [bacterium]|nr:exo-alpha-sialidase [bacterium]
MSSKVDLVYSGPGSGPGEVPTKLYAVGQANGYLLAAGYRGIPARDCGVPFAVLSRDSGDTWDDISADLDPGQNCGTITAAVPGADGGLTLVGDMDQGGLTVWDSTDGEQWSERTVSGPDGVGPNPLGAVTAVMSGDQLITASGFGSIFDASGSSAVLLGELGYGPEAIDVLEDGSLIATGSPEYGDGQRAMTSRSTDGGRTWSESPPPTGNLGDDYTFAHGAATVDGATIVAGSGFDSGVLGWRSDGSWTSLELPHEKRSSAGLGVLAGQGWVAIHGSAFPDDEQAAGVWLSCDKGASWEPNDVRPFDPADTSYFAIVDALVVDGSIYLAGFEDYTGDEYVTRAVVWRMNEPECPQGAAEDAETAESADAAASAGSPDELFQELLVAIQDHDTAALTRMMPASFIEGLDDFDAFFERFDEGQPGIGGCEDNGEHGFSCLLFAEPPIAQALSVTVRNLGDGRLVIDYAHVGSTH